MKKLVYIFFFFILFSSCLNYNKDYTATLEIKRMALSRSPWDSTYVFFIEGYIWNHSKDSIWVIPFDKHWKVNYYHYRLPSYIVGSINGQNIEFKKVGGSGKLDSGDCFHVFLYKEIKEKQIPSKYLIDHVQDLRFSYVPTKDSTAFIKDRLEFYNYMVNWMKEEPSLRDHIPNYNSYFEDFKLYKDSSEMHFVNKMNFYYRSKPMRIEELINGRDITSLFL